MCERLKRVGVSQCRHTSSLSSAGREKNGNFGGPFKDDWMERNSQISRIGDGLSKSIVLTVRGGRFVESGSSIVAVAMKRLGNEVDLICLRGHKDCFKDQADNIAALGVYAPFLHSHCSQ